MLMLCINVLEKCPCTSCLDDLLGTSYCLINVWILLVPCLMYFFQTQILYSVPKISTVRVLR